MSVMTPVCGKRYVLSQCPPSLNNCYLNRRGGRVKSKSYNQWLLLAQQEILSQRLERVRGPYALALRIARKLTRADLDNLTKPIADLLVAVGATDDDRLLMKHSAEFVSGHEVEIRVSRYALKEMRHTLCPVCADRGVVVRGETSDACPACARVAEMQYGAHTGKARRRRKRQIKTDLNTAMRDGLAHGVWGVSPKKPDYEAGFKTSAKSKENNGDPVIFAK